MDFPKGGLLGKAAALIRRVQQMNIPGHAANACYFIVLALIPMLVLVLSVLRYTGLDAGDLLEWASAYIPRALEAVAERIVVLTYAYSGLAVVSVSAVSALWSASRCIFGILRGLNAIYDVQEDRGWLYKRLISVGYTFVFLAVVVLSLALNVFGEQVRTLLPFRAVSDAVDLRILLMLLLQTAVFAAMYAWLPNRHNSLRGSLPGAALASMGWQIFSYLFSWYVEHWAGGTNLYGSVYALALGMLWLYCCMSILFYGAALNRLLEENREKM